MPWSISYQKNTIKNMKIGLAMANQVGFYSPNTDDDDYLIDLSQTLTNVTYAASFAYKNAAGTTPFNQKWLPGAEYIPNNNDVYPLAPTVVNPNGYTVVTGAI